MEVITTTCPVCGVGWVVFPLPQCSLCDAQDEEE